MKKRQGVVEGWADICPPEDQKLKCLGVPKIESYLFKRKYDNSELARVCFPTRLGKDSIKREMLMCGVKTRNLIDKDGNRFTYEVGRETIKNEKYHYKQFTFKRQKSDLTSLISEKDAEAAKVTRYKRKGQIIFKIEM